MKRFSMGTFQVNSRHEGPNHGGRRTRYKRVRKHVAEVTKTSDPLEDRNPAVAGQVPLQGLTKKDSVQETGIAPLLHDSILLW